MRQHLPIQTSLFLACLQFSSLNAIQAQEVVPRKIAFLVGVNDYFKKNFQDLSFAENDVTVVAKHLRELGFETTVLTARDATQEKINSELNQFIEKASELESDDIVFAMFSGHGQELPTVVTKEILFGDEQKLVQSTETSPFFCARDAIPYDKDKHSLRGKSEQQIAEEFNLVPFNRLIGKLDDESNSLRNLLIVDACRNDPSKGGKAANISGSTVRELPTGLSVLFSANGSIPYGSETKGPFLRRTCNVGSYQCNAFGLHDMSGNVSERCSDWYDEELLSYLAGARPAWPCFRDFSPYARRDWVRRREELSFCDSA